MSRRAWACLTFILVGSAVVSSLSLNRGHNWGDDFAGYVMQAESIVHNNTEEFVRRNAFTMEVSSRPVGPVMAPWGFPLMLAPVYAVFGMKILALKSLLVVCYAVFLTGFFLLARTRIPGSQALLLTAVLAFNPRLLNAQNEILSDLPFLAFSFTALWLIYEYGEGLKRGSTTTRLGIAVGFAIFAAAFVREQGMLLLLTLASAQLPLLPGIARGTVHRWRLAVRMVIPFLVFAILYAGQSLFFPDAPFLNRAAHLGRQAPWAHIWGYFWLPPLFFDGLGPASYALYLLLLVFFAISLRSHWQRDFPIHLYALAILGVQVAFPAAPQPRYLYPVWPLLLLFSFDGMLVAARRAANGRRMASTRLVNWVWAALACVSLAFSARTAVSNVVAGRTVADQSGDAFSPASLELFDFIRDHTPPDSVIIFFKPRAMRLLTDRNTIMTTDCDDLPQGDYVTLMKDGGYYNQIAPSRIGSCDSGVQLTRVYGKDDFEVYQIEEIQ